MYLVIGRENCSYCDKAKELLTSQGKGFVYVDITSGEDFSDSVWKQFLVTDMGVNTVPQIFNLIGGYEDLRLDILYE
jgi:glutaredoxin